MKSCPKCGAPVADSASFCIHCGTKQLEKAISSNNGVGAEPTSISPTPIEPTPIEPTPINPTPIEPTPIEPTPINPTPIEPTPIEPTSIQPTPIQPTAIKPFSFKVLLWNGIGALIAAIAFAIAINLGLGSFIDFIPMIIFALCMVLGLSGMVKEIMKLPIQQALIDQFNARLKAGQTPINLAKLTTFQKIRFRVFSATVPIRVVSLASVGAMLLTLVISIPSALVGGSNLPTTSITGVWVHELGYKMGETSGTWVVNITMWSVSESDPGFVYMNVNEGGTFNVTYNSEEVSYGEWEETENNNYQFLYHDPDQVLMGIYEDYQIRGNDLVQGYGPNSIYCTKQ